MLLAPVVFASLLSATMVSCPQDKPKFEMATYQFALFVDGPKKGQLSKEQAGKLQAEHLNRLQELWESRKALVVGPVMNGGPLRGVVVFDLAKKEEAEKIMAADPFVKAGELAYEVRPWLAGKNYMLKGPEFLDLEPVWLGVLKRPADAPTVTKEEGAKIQEGHMANINKMAEEGALLLAGPFLEDTPWRGLFIFKNLPKEKVLELAGRDPAIKARRLELEVFKWLSAKGSWKQPKQ